MKNAIPPPSERPVPVSVYVCIKKVYIEIKKEIMVQSIRRMSCAKILYIIKMRHIQVIAE